MFEQIKEILAKYTETEITEESTLEADLGLSSFDIVSIVTDFEDVFDIEISDRELSKFISISDIIEYLKTA